MKWINKGHEYDDMYMNITKKKVFLFIQITLIYLKKNLDKACNNCSYCNVVAMEMD